jgi:hypothetical protein
MAKLAAPPPYDYTTDSATSHVYSNHLCVNNILNHHRNLILTSFLEKEKLNENSFKIGVLLPVHVLPFFLYLFRLPQ